MYKTIRTLTVIALLGTVAACSGGPAIGSEKNNVEGAGEITAAAPEAEPKTGDALVALLQGDAKGRLTANAGPGAWEYEPADATRAPLKSPSTVYFTTRTAGTSLSTFVMESETSCSAPPCARELHAYAELSVTGTTVGIAIDRGAYELLGKFPDMPGASGARATDGYLFGTREANGQEIVAFTLKRYYVRQ